MHRTEAMAAAALAITSASSSLPSASADSSASIDESRNLRSIFVRYCRLTLRPRRVSVGNLFIVASWCTASD
jgi:hypothetical protein